jgi:hypothetical protein
MSDEPLIIIPTKTEISQLTAKDRTINFSVWEEIGFPVYRYTEGLVFKDRAEWDAFRDDNANLFLDPDSLQAGVKILVGANAVAEVIGVGESMHGISPNGKVTYFLQYETDRPVGASCWKCTGVGNLAGIKRLELYKDKESE